MLRIMLPQEISRSGVVRAAPVNGAFDVHLTAPFIRDAELRSLKPVLGAALLADMIAKRGAEICNYNADLGATVKAFPGATGIDEAYELLWVSHVFEFMGLATMWLALPSIRTQAQSGGLIYMADHNTSSSAREDMKDLISHYDHLLQHRAKDMRDWLCENRANYPLFDAAPCDTCGTSNTNNYTHIIPY